MVGFLIIGISLMVMRHVDFWQGAVFLHTDARDWPDILAIIGLFILAVVATLRFKREQYLRLFFGLSLVFMLDHAVWFSMMQYFFGVSSIPISESLPYFKEAWLDYLSWFGVRTIFLHGLSFVTAYVFLRLVAAVTVRVRIVWDAMIKELCKGK